METISDRLLNWASILEPATRVQAERTASMPFVRPHVALMPDAHLGLGATVGSVIPTGTLWLLGSGLRARRRARCGPASPRRVAPQDGGASRPA